MSADGALLRPSLPRCCQGYFGCAPPLAIVSRNIAPSKGSATTFWRFPESQVLEHAWKHPLWKRSQRRLPTSKAPMHVANRSGKGWDCLSELAQPPHVPEEKNRFFRTALVTGYIVEVLRPQLERLGLSIVRPSHGSAPASFAIIKQSAVGDAQGNSILCVPVHVRIGHFVKSTGYTKFSNTKGQSGLVVLVEANDGLAPSQPVTWDSPVAVYLLAGRSISTTTMNLVPTTRSRYAHYRLATYEDLASAVVEFARRVLDNEKGSLEDGCAVMVGRTTFPVRDFLPLPTLEQMTTPKSEPHKRAMEAYTAFFGAEGLLADPVMQALLMAEREEGSRSGRFMLTCKLNHGDVQLRASGHQARVQPGGVRFNTYGGQVARLEPVLIGKVDVTVVYTPCLGGCYFIPEFALAQRGVLKIAGRSAGQVTSSLQPYGGGRDKTRAWNMFLVDCKRSEDWMYARCHEILALAAEGKAKGWEAMPPMEELGLAPVTMSVPATFAERLLGPKSQEQHHGS